MRMKLKFEPRDLWFGVHWKADTLCKVERVPTAKHGPWIITSRQRVYYVYICIIPTLPIILTFASKWETNWPERIEERESANTK